MFGFGKKIDVETINKEIGEGSAVLVDVRNDNEWEAGHAKGAMHLSVDRILNGEAPTTDTSKKVYLYCASGGRSGMATSYLQGKGYDAENIGGLSSWRGAGGEVE